jgi:preprotein translocase subunit SecG
MFGLLLTLHVFVCLAMIFIVLLQYGRGAEMGAAFGGSNQTVFGSGGAGTFMGKVTTVAAITFMVTSLSLAYLSAQRNTSSSIIPQAAPTAPADAVPDGEALPAGDAAPAEPLPLPVEEGSPAAE